MLGRYSPSFFLNIYCGIAIVLLRASNPQKNPQFISPPVEAGDFLRIRLKVDFLKKIVNCQAKTHRPKPAGSGPPSLQCLFFRPAVFPRPWNPSVESFRAGILNDCTRGSAEVKRST
jgi:hypothetical protein